ncbi:MAG TPA: MBOAT family protein [Paenibacillus sp.]|nr:MBOAT family protein [Paenibacillus sp.]
MLFNSYEFIFLFLPLSFACYFLLLRARTMLPGLLFLTAASLFFYGWWNPRYLLLLLASIGFNYVCGRMLARLSPSVSRARNALLAGGIAGNVILLAYYKYAAFLVAVAADATGLELTWRTVVLPLGISFFTFTQIAYLVDAYKGKAKEYSIVGYTLFVTFFPHLIAGPILHHADMMPQFSDDRNRRWNWSNIYKGTYLFCVGLAKKVIVADSFATYADAGFEKATGFADAWVASLAFTFQLYFDFSGYSDMAVGAALLFNIRLPQNFNSPYRSTNIREFWNRWHITLGRFLRDYIYIPLGGNRKGGGRTARNLMATFLIGGLWHGAGWTFIAWGALHGAGQIVYRLWSKAGRQLPPWLAWCVTFLFVNVGWVLFRAESLPQALRLLRGMAGMNGSGLSGPGVEINAAALLLSAFVLVLWTRNSNGQAQALNGRRRTVAYLSALFVVSLLFLNRIQTFLYFNF